MSSVQVEIHREREREIETHDFVIFFLPSLTPSRSLPSHPSVDELLMKGVTVVVYTGQLDLIVDTMGRPLCNVNKRCNVDQGVWFFTYQTELSHILVLICLSGFIRMTSCEQAWVLYLT